MIDSLDVSVFRLACDGMVRLAHPTARFAHLARPARLVHPARFARLDGEHTTGGPGGPALQDAACSPTPTAGIPTLL